MARKEQATTGRTAPAPPTSLVRANEPADQLTRNAISEKLGSVMFSSVRYAKVLALASRLPSVAIRGHAFIGRRRLISP
ncbi:hypothetical protein EVAR_76009_1 [Eumeta japonica]|uniref:Uncharacterized protein n=1 Tax=Eumeta variegata TaxID=151549 RepID=A0A4C1UA56_EUMVA|nr:hypothetical protein EVAR_76009_1 [Eumeta japonica]